MLRSFMLRSNKLKVTIIVPTYNEEGHIENTILLLEKMFLQHSNYEFSILVFDSHSSDNTVKIVKNLQQQFENVILLGEEKKSGLGSAYIQAMKYVINNTEADVVFEFDADGSHQPHYIPDMLAAIDTGADVVMGSRYVNGGIIDADWAWHRHMISKTGNWVAQLFLTPKYRDITSGFRATKVSYLKKVQLDKLLSKNYAYKINLFWDLLQLGAKIQEIPITFIDREHGLSKFPKNNILDSLKVVIILWWRKFI